LKVRKFRYIELDFHKSFEKGDADMIESPVERLVKTHPDMEIWWDSSPLVYIQWTQKMLSAAEPSRRPILEEQLGRLYNVESPAKSVFRGCTTNPPLSWQAIKSDPVFWGEWIDDLIRSHPEMRLKEIVWEAYKEVVKRGAEMYLPIFEASRGRFGWISGQLDPRLTETG
jgi:transaldolase